MELDVKKVSKTPKNQWEAIEFLNESNQKLIEALHIMNSVIINDEEDFKEVHKKRISDFIKQFE